MTKNFNFKDFIFTKTPTTSNNWLKLNNKERIAAITAELKKKKIGGF